MSQFKYTLTRLKLEKVYFKYIMYYGRLAAMSQTRNGQKGDLLPDRVGKRTIYALCRPNNVIMSMYRISTSDKSFLPNMVNKWNGLSLEENNNCFQSCNI